MQPFLRFLPLFCAPLLVACSANVDVFGTGGGDSTSTQTTGVGPGSTTGNPTTSQGTTVSGTTSVVSSSSTGTPCDGDPNGDFDGDGFTPNTGDCNDCDAAYSPNNLDIPGNGADDDCDGSIDQPLEPCDEMLTIDEADPMVAASAIELCKPSSGPDSWGLVSATWVLADGTPPPSNPDQLALFHLGHGLLDNFGSVIVPRAGARLLALSNANARDTMDPGYADPSGGEKGYTSAAPPGSPIPSVGCVGAQPGEPNDPIALEVLVRAPDNAQGFTFDSYFLATDWPGFVCSQYDDTFFALLDPAPVGSINGQIAFSPDGSPISLNGAPFDVCSCMTPPCMAGGKVYACAQGDGALAGTGFETHAGTGWMTTAAPVSPGSEIQLRIGIYDAGDPLLGATALVDSFAWLTSGGIVVSTTPSP